MSQGNNVFHVLAFQVQQGDLAALAELERHLGPATGVIVRRALRTRSVALALTRRIRGLASETGDPVASNSPQFVTEIAESLCQSAVTDLQGKAGRGQEVKDTVVG